MQKEKKMNDFTKEELEYLYQSIDNIVECYSEPDIGYLVRDKIQRMLDNYCEHHWVTDPRLHFMSNPPQIKCICIKCGRYEMKEIINE